MIDAKIIITVGKDKKKIELSLEEAKQVYNELKELFGKENIQFPYIHYTPYKHQTIHLRHQEPYYIGDYPNSDPKITC